MAGWRALEERERAELRTASHVEKFRALAFLMASADLFDLSQLESEDAVGKRALLNFPLPTRDQTIPGARSLVVE